MKHLFIPYELAVIAKEKGFNEPCLTFYCNGKLYEEEDTFEEWFACTNEDTFGESKNCTAPLYQQIVDWFRENHNIYLHIADVEQNQWMYYIKSLDKSRNMIYSMNNYKTYYESLNKAIKEAFNLLK